MIVVVLLLLLVAALVLGLLRRRRSYRAVFVLALVLFFAVGCGMLPRLMLRDLQAVGGPVPVWQPKTAIIVLGGGTERVVDTGAVEPELASYGRILRGLELYLQCKRAGEVCVLVASGGDARKSGASEAKVYGEILTKTGVDPADLVIEDRSMNTWQNAQFCEAWLRDHPQDQVVLVTSGFHLRRALLYFAHFGIRAVPVRADYVDAIVTPVPQAYNFLLTDLALHEYTGLLRYRVYNLLGWNVQARNPRAL
jgi:uncharacterized SAM-binding protein YcdF (DUF218 family)